MDKIKHFVGCAFITFVMFLLTCDLIAAASIGIAVGLSKEIYDQLYGTGFDWEDLVADVLGVSVTVLLLWRLYG